MLRSAEAHEPSSVSGWTTSWPITGAHGTGSWPRSRMRRRPTFPPLATYPEPVEHCDVCRWAAECVARRRADDHLSLVSGISARQRRALTQRGVATLESLGDLSVPMDPPLADVGAGALSRVHEQARIQLEGRRESRLKYELLLPRPDAEIELERGLASLPPPSPGDLFFDIEGDPYALDDGLDYLFGVLETDGTFHAIWSRDDAGEFSLDGRAARLRAPDGLRHGPPRAGSRRCTSTTTRRTSRPP